MRFLIITQVVDRNHPVLGFFHGWITAFASRCSSVHVIALQVGEYDLPNNVYVHSLGKEDGESRLKYLWRFYMHIWKLRNQYDSVFVHMNQLYVILGGLLWRLGGKKIGLWYAHGAVTASLRLAVLMAHTVFTSTPQGMRVATKKLVIVGQGIDPDQFLNVERNESNTLRLVTVGRVAQSKNIETLLNACKQLRDREIQFHFTIVGGASTSEEEMYENRMHLLCKELGIDSSVTWKGPLPHDQLPSILLDSDVFIHDGSTNSLDKTLVEAVFAGCVVISSNPSYRGLTETIAPELLFSPKNAEQLAAIIEHVHARGSDNTKHVQNALLKSCSLPGLVSAIVSRY